MGDRRLLPERKVCARYGVTPMTLYRWDRDPDLAFPKPIEFRNRNYRASRNLMSLMLA